MAWFIRLVGFVWIIAGAVGSLATKRALLALDNFMKNTRRQTLGLISLILGLLLLISASSTQAVWFIMALGLMACLKAAVILSMPRQKFKAAIDWWLAAPEIVYKGWAAFILLLGIAILCSI